MVPIYINPPSGDWEELTRRAEFSDDDIVEAVEAILARVRRDGDKALREITAEVEGRDIDCFEVSGDEIAGAAAEVPQELKEALEIAARNIRLFHEAQRQAEVDVTVQPGVRCVQRVVPIQRVGLYIPGGTAPLFSTVLMLAIPAQVAGCSETILCTPAGKDGRVAPAVLYAAQLCGVGHVFKAGGAQAIAAMAYGTDSIPKVDKIFGPGNRYVTKAKQLVSVADVAIDMPAGPSEVLVMADRETAVPEFVAADMLSQAEHGADSQAILVCNCEQFAAEVDRALEKQAAGLSRQEATVRALANSRIIVLPTRGEMIDFANAYAAEHLIIQMPDPWEAAARITAAGSVFIGNWSPESAGDYASGTNHTLPTAGWARACSGVNLDSFTRKITYQELSREGLGSLAGTITTMAEAEGLDAHANAVAIRIQKMKDER